MDNRDLEIIFLQKLTTGSGAQFLFIYTDLTKWNGSSQAHTFVPIYEPQKKLRASLVFQF
jgi:hypothetical protein